MKPNSIRIRIRVIFSHRMVFIFAGHFFNTIHILKIYTGCICLSLLCYKFSNVSSKHSDQSRHNGIVCIDLTFLHCVLSRVISNILHEQRKTHTGCSCLIFLYCVFSSAFSTCLLQRVHDNTGCIFLTFSTVHFQMHP